MGKNELFGEDKMVISEYDKIENTKEKSGE